MQPLSPAQGKRRDPAIVRRDGNAAELSRRRAQPRTARCPHHRPWTDCPDGRARGRRWSCAAGAGRWRAASRSTISVRKGGISRTVAASSSPTASTNIPRPPTPRRSARIAGCSRLRTAACSALRGSRAQHPEVGEAYTLLTAEPGPDVAPYHRRQIVLLHPDRWSDWLNPAIPSSELLRPSEEGYLNVERA